MTFLPEEIQYLDAEKSKLALLESLFRDWHQHFVNNRSGLYGHDPDYMVFDGFYPYYFNQKIKILFIGREPLGISGENNMDILGTAYRESKRISGRHLNRDNFHSRMLRIAWGINHRFLDGKFPAWNDIPEASVIGDTFAMSSGLSFAFMNISKLSNDSGAWKANWPVISAAHSLSARPRNFIEEEIAILEPHIVIAMNLGDRLEDGIDSLGRGSLIHGSRQATSYWLDSRDHRSLLIDPYHFAAVMPDVAGFYDPICDAIRRSESGSN